MVVVIDLGSCLSLRVSGEIALWLGDGVHVVFSSRVEMESLKVVRQSSAQVNSTSMFAKSLMS